jgi:hypothetical protein
VRPCSIGLVGSEVFEDDLPDLSFIALMLGKRGMMNYVNANALVKVSNGHWKRENGYMQCREK